MVKRNIKNDERRKFIRLDRIFPVEFQFLDPQTQKAISVFHQAFTDNVSKGGLALTINDPEPEVRDLIEKKPDILLKIKMPLSGPFIHAKGELKWLVKKKDDDVEQYLCGISYKEIHPADNRKILRYAYIKKFTPIIILSIIAILFASVSFSFYFNIKLIKSNLGIAHDLFSILHKSRQAKNIIKEIKKEKDELDLELSRLSIKTESLNEKLLTAGRSEEKVFFEEELKKVNEEIAAIKQEAANLYIKEAQITEDLLSVEKKKPNFSDKDIEGMYDWVKSLQDKTDGQIKVPGVNNQDYFLACQLYNFFGDYDQAKKIIDSYLTNPNKALSPDEKLDLAINVLKYSWATKDPYYINLANDLIGQSLAAFKNTQTDEFQLKLYALLNIYLKLKWDDAYNQAYRRLTQYLKLPSHPDTLFDYLLIMNINKLNELDIADIITNLEDNFSCTKPYSLTPDGTSKQVKGFIFSLDKNDASRNFIIDTSKMILIYKLTAKFFEIRRDIYRAKFYRDKAFLYLNELVIFLKTKTSSSQKFMPYIEGPFSGQGSISATAFTIFAYYNYNIFVIDEG